MNFAVLVMLCDSRSPGEFPTVNPDTTMASEGATEWLVTNGLGGYASGTLIGLVTRHDISPIMESCIAHEDTGCELMERAGQKSAG